MFAFEGAGGTGGRGRGGRVGLVKRARNFVGGVFGRLRRGAANIAARFRR